MRSRDWALSQCIVALFVFDAEDVAVVGVTVDFCCRIALCICIHCCFPFRRIIPAAAMSQQLLQARVPILCRSTTA
jgi:hypothetical protein